jgi:hypothetical protein
MARLRADAVVATEAERASLAALRQATGAEDGPMERHCLRVFVIAERLGVELDRRPDREVLLCASLLHDIGGYPLAAGEGPYTADGARFALGLLDRFEWPEIRLRACADAIEQHHQLMDQWERGPDAELVRRADLIDVAGGLVSFGLSRGWLRGLFRAVPRAGLYGEIAGIVARIARDRPDTLPQVFV